MHPYRVRSMEYRGTSTMSYAVCTSDRQSSELLSLPTVRVDQGSVVPNSEHILTALLPACPLAPGLGWAGCVGVCTYCTVRSTSVESCTVEYFREVIVVVVLCTVVVILCIV